MIKKVNPKWLWIAGSCVCVIILFLVLLLTTRHKQADIPEGMSIAALEDAALAGNISTGDIVQIYAADGTVIPQLQYVKICGVTEGNGLLLALDSTQMAAFAQHDSVTPALIVRSGSHADELLAMQQQILYPSITLQLPETLVLEPGSTLLPELTVSSDPENGIIPEIIWDSSDLSICSINDGLLTTGEVGQAVVTASCGEASASCNVIVRIPLSTLQLSTTEAAMAVGDTIQLIATPEPADSTNFTASWVSDDPAVATAAEDGTVTAIAAGSAVITASCGEVSSSCSITVGVHTELVQLAQHTISLNLNDTLPLEYAIYPAENNLDGVSFTSSAPEIVTVGEDGAITAVGYGTATITISSGSATDTCTVTVTANPG